MDCGRCFLDGFPISLHVAVKITKFRVEIMPCTKDVENSPSFVKCQGLAPECKHACVESRNRTTHELRMAERFGDQFNNWKRLADRQDTLTDLFIFFADCCTMVSRSFRLPQMREASVLLDVTAPVTLLNWVRRPVMAWTRSANAPRLPACVLASRSLM